VSEAWVTDDDLRAARARFATTQVFRLSSGHIAEAVERLTPAEAATHMPHPNLWSWRALLAEATRESTFLAFFIANRDDPPTDQDDARFRRLLHG
jgi:hypothetical protein